MVFRIILCHNLLPPVGVFLQVGFGCASVNNL